MARVSPILSGRWKWAIATASGIALVLLPIVLGIPIVSLAAALVLVLYMPGAQIAKWLGLFKKWNDVQSFCLSVAASMIVSPPLLYWAGWVLGFQKGTILVVLSGFVLLLSLVNSYQKAAGSASFPPLVESKSHAVWLAAVLAVSACLLWLPFLDLHTASGVYPVEMTDWRKHYGTVWSLEQTGIPPRNVFFAALGPTFPLIYYYFFYLPVAAVDMVAHVQPHIHLVLTAVIIIEIILLQIMSYIFAKRFFQSERAALWAVGLLAFVGGLDVIPMLIQAGIRWVRFPPAGEWTWLALLHDPHIESWASPTGLRLNIFYVLSIWVPQHVASMSIALFGLYFYLMTPYTRRFMIFLPVLLFSIVGHSTFVALVALGGIGTFAGLELITRWKQGDAQARQRLVFGSVGIAIASLVISAPFLWQVFGTPLAPKPGIVFEIPTPGILFGIPNSDYFVMIAPFRLLWGDRQWTRLLDVPLHTFLELGIFSVAGLLGLRQFLKKGHYPRITWLWLAWLAIGFAATFFFTSGRAQAAINYIGFNDLGFRAPILGQLALVLFAGYYLATLHWWQGSWLTKLGHGLLASLIVLGVLATGWEFTAMGVLKYLKPPRIDSGNYQALAALPEVTKPLSIVQHRNLNDVYLGQLEYGDRLIAVTEIAEPYYPVATTISDARQLAKAAFDADLAAESYQKLRALNIDYVYLEQRALQPNNFPTKFRNSCFFQPVYTSGAVRVYQLFPWFAQQPLATFTPQAINFMGYVLDASITTEAPIDTSPSLGQPFLVTAWQLSSPVPDDYTLYVHFITADGRVVAQADHQLASRTMLQGIVPTSKWEPGSLYLDIVPVPPEVQDAKVPLHIGIGLWIPQTEAHLLPQSAPLTIDAATRLIIGTYSSPTCGY
jgi:hypothetical protein